MSPDLTVRAATEADYEHFALFFAELGVDDPVLPPDRWLVELCPHTILLGPAGAPVAYGMAMPLDGFGYVHHVVVHSSCRGRGVGRALLSALAVRLRGLGCTRWCLNVKIDNQPALALYERFGFRRMFASTALSLEWDAVGLLPREDAAPEARVVEAGEDAALEAAFDMPPGRLANARARPGRVLLRLADPARPAEAKLGVACFDPAFPGAAPFLVARPSLAAHLLESLRPHARPGDAFLRLMIENDAPLTATLRAAGAKTWLEAYHLRGDIP
jgi:GNAT superfamily N-acetyltransferase